MFTKKCIEKSKLEKARDEALDVLLQLDPEDECYAKTLKKVEKLSNLMYQESPEKLDCNVLLQVGGTIIAVALIVGHERAHVLTSKALAFLPKLMR